MGLLGLVAEPGEGGFHFGAVEDPAGLIEGWRGVEFHLGGEQAIEGIDAHSPVGMGLVGREREGVQEFSGPALEHLGWLKPPDGEASSRARMMSGNGDASHGAGVCWLGRRKIRMSALSVPRSCWARFEGSAG